MPSGSVMRRIFGEPSGSANSASAAGAPCVVRSSVRVTQIFFGCASHSFTHGVETNVGIAAATGACAGGAWAGGAGCWACAVGGFGVLGLGLVAGACAFAAATSETAAR